MICQGQTKQAAPCQRSTSKKENADIRFCWQHQHLRYSKPQIGNTTHNYFCELSNLVLLGIVKYLFKRDIDNLCLVSKQCHKKIRSNKSLWAGVLAHYKYGQKFDTDTAFDSYKRYITSVMRTYVFGPDISNFGLTAARTSTLTLLPNMTGLKDADFGQQYVAYVDYWNNLYVSGSNNISYTSNHKISLEFKAKNIKAICCLRDALYVLDFNGGLAFTGHGVISFNTKDHIFTTLHSGVVPIYRHVISQVTDLKKVTIDSIMIKINGQYYFNEPTKTLDDMVEFEKVLFTKSGEIGPVLDCDTYCVLYKPIFRIPDLQSFSLFNHFHYSPNGGFIIDHNCQAIVFVCTETQINIHKIKQLKPVKGMVWATYIYWINDQEQLFRYDLRRHRNYKLLSEPIRSLHQFSQGIFALARDGTLFYEGDNSGLIKKLFPLNTNDLFLTLTPVLNNVDFIAVCDQSIIVSLLQGLP